MLEGCSEASTRMVCAWPSATEAKNRLASSAVRTRREGHKGLLNIPAS